MAIEIREVNGIRDLKKFVKFPFQLYKNHEFWIPPLINGEMNTLRAGKNPSLEHCEWKYLLAYKDSRLAGRIAGIINKPFNEKKGKKHARFCWFDFIDDKEVSYQLMKAVIEWAKSKGMDKIIGPMGFTTFEKQGVLCEGFDSLPTFSAAYNHPYYPSHFEHQEFQKEIDYVEYKIKIPEKIPDKVLKINKLIKKRYGLKTLYGKSKEELMPYAKQVFEILNLAYEPLYGFVKLSNIQIDYFVKKYFSFIDADFVVVILNKEDQPIGFQIAAPNLSKALQKSRGKLLPFGIFHLIRARKKAKTLDLMLIGIHPDYQNKGVNALIMSELQNSCQKRGMLYAESNGEMEENEKVQSIWKHYDAKQYKRNRIYYKDLL